MTKVAVIIPSLASEATLPYLKLTVESLRATVDWDIIVVTNGTKAKPILDDIYGITQHMHTRDQGQCNAVNIGAQVASPATDYLFISNDDMYYAPGWNINLEFNKLVLSPNLVEPTDNNGSAQPFLKFNGGYTLDNFNQEAIDKHIRKSVKEWQDAETGAGEQAGFNFPVFIKKDFWNFLGGYDVAYDPWGSNGDTDLQTRINLAGVSPVRLRDVLVYHFSNKSGTFDGTHQDYYLNNLEYFHDKFGFDRDELGSDVWYNKDMIPTDASKIKYKQKKYDD